MTGMDGKRDPGKFTVRFNLRDPQQRRAAELLNQQGRSKAQFIANAVLCYAGGQAPIPQGEPTMGSEQLRQLVENVLAQRQEPPQQISPAGPTAPSPAADVALNDTERRVIFQTLDAFQQQ